MDRQTSDAVNAVAPSINYVALLLVLVPVGDFLANVWPLRFGEDQWRYGAVGLFSGFLLTPLLGLLIAMAMAVLRRQRRTLVTLSILEFVGATILLLACLVFALDAVTLRAQLAPTAKQGLEAAVIKALIKHVLGIIALVWFGLNGLKAAKALTSRDSQKREGPAPLVVGT